MIESLSMVTSVPINASWVLIIPEIGLTVLILLTLIGELWLPDHLKRWLVILNGFGLAWLMGWALLAQQDFYQLFYGFYLVDAVSNVMRILFLAAGLFILLMSRQDSPGGHQERGPFLLLLLLATLGMVFTASAGDLLTLFLAIELVTFSFYVMITYLRTDPRSVEAGLKYLILGGVSSAITLFGIALVYAGTGTTSLNILASNIAVTPSTSLCFAGLAMMVGGLGFKIGMVPFHMWVPDVYQGAPTPVSAFLSVGSKAAGCVALLRIAPLLLILDRQKGMWLIGMGAVLSLLYGNLGAIPQKSFKRLLGYSSIGHVGYMLMTFLSPSLGGAKSLVFYLFSYFFATGLAFFVATICQRHFGNDDMASLKGLISKSPLLAGSLFIALISLAGVPPFAGFFAKFLAITLVVREGTWWLATIGLLMVPVSLYYYLMVIKIAMTTDTKPVEPISLDALTRTSLALAVMAIVILGVFQRPLYQLVSGKILNY